jgi:hypothetical protein
MVQNLGDFLSYSKMQTQDTQLSSQVEKGHMNVTKRIMLNSTNQNKKVT